MRPSVRAWRSSSSRTAHLCPAPEPNQSPLGPLPRRRICFAADGSTVTVARLDLFGPKPSGADDWLECLQ